ncbi:MAG: BrnT family toxin [Pyrinomonadaceae bacterium]|nr:BrnT family toxin [Pyrinomonadaceae bacterium]
MNDLFEWDPAKAESNLVKHGVSFEEAQTVFFDALSLTVSDPTHSVSEERFIITGHSILDRQLVVVHTDRDGKIRIISARLANRHERQQYEQEER